MSLNTYETSDLLIQFLGIYPTEFTKINKDELVGWHHRLDEHEFEQGPGVGDGQGSFAFCSKWVCKEANTTERLN